MRHHRRGATIVSTMIILTGLMVVASTTALLLNAESRSTGYTAMARRSLYCAEAGLVTARAIAAANYATWPQALDADPGNDPPWYPIRGHLEQAATGAPDFEDVEFEGAAAARAASAPVALFFTVAGSPLA